MLSMGLSFRHCVEIVVLSLAINGVSSEAPDKSQAPRNHAAIQKSLDRFLIIRREKRVMHGYVRNWNTLEDVQ